MPRNNEEEQEEKQNARKVIDQRSGKYLVLDKQVDVESGDVFYVLAAAGVESPETVRVRVVTDASVDKSGVLRALGSKEPIDLDLLLREGAKESNIWEAWSAPVVAPPKVSGASLTDEQRFFIRERTVDKKTGEIFWLVSPTDKNAPEQLMKIRVSSDPNVDKNGIGKSLAAWSGDSATLNLTRRENSKVWEVWGVEPPPTEQARTVLRPDPESEDKDNPKKLPAFVWTPNLDDMVDKYHSYKSYEDVSQSFEGLSGEPKTYSKICDKAFTEYENAVRQGAERAKVNVTEEDIRRLWKSERSQRPTLQFAMYAVETAPDGSKDRVFYDTERRFDTQLKDEPLSLEAISSAAANYAIQKSIAGEIVERVSTPVTNEEGESVSRYEIEENKLVSNRILFDKNPLLSPEQKAVEGRELAEMNAAKVLRNMLSLAGARASVPGADDVRHGPPFATFQAEVRAHAESLGLLPSDEEMMTDPTALVRAQNGIIRAGQELARIRQGQIVDGKDGIKHEQDHNGAVKPPFHRARAVGLSKKQIEAAEKMKTHSLRGVDSALATVDEYISMD